MFLPEIQQKLNRHQTLLEDYFRKEFEKTPPPPYLSCDLRNSGFKLAVVDTNLYPAGFNNLCAAFHKQAQRLFRAYFEEYYPGAKRILIFTEAHTRNKFYFENLYSLSQILLQAGFDVRLATISSEFKEEKTLIPLDEAKSIALERVKREANTICLRDWVPDLLLSNNDFSSGAEKLFDNIRQPLIPPMKLGWYQRKKSDHFSLYNRIAEDVSEILQIDPWLISCTTEVEQEVNLQDEDSLKRLANKVDRVIAAIQEKYDAHHIETAPYVFVKNNSGTYGMGVTYVMSGEELLQMNRRMKTKLVATKGGGEATNYLIQEGVVTRDSYSGYPIEPVIYMAGSAPIGGFFRLNELKDEWSSLNSKGMAFSCLCLHKFDEPHEAPYLKCEEKRNLIEASYFLTRIAALAAAREAI